jgi:hypothetical protein
MRRTFHATRTRFEPPRTEFDLKSAKTRKTCSQRGLCHSKLEGTCSKLEGTCSKPEGTCSKPEGTYSKPEGTCSKPEGTYSKLEDTYSKPEGTCSKPDGTRAKSEVRRSESEGNRPAHFKYLYTIIFCHAREGGHPADNLASAYLVERKAALCNYLDSRLRGNDISRFN